MAELFIVSGPSGAGKDTILKAAFETLPSLSYSVSATTRDPRPGEVDGTDYHFIDEAAFEAHIAAGDFIEHKHVHDHYYGTPKQGVLDLLEAGRDVVANIDVQGAAQIKETLPFGTYIFIMPPSMRALEERLTARGTEDEAQIALRLQNAKTEMTEASKYDYVIFNDDLDAAVSDFVSIVRATHLKTAAQAQNLKNFFDA